MKKSFLLFAAILLMSVSASAQGSMSGSGTVSDPYKIYYPDQLHQVRNYLNQDGVYFRLMNNIDISDWNEANNPGQGWEPIGVASAPFKGVFDGNNKKITGFSITRSSTNYVGLFGYISGATVKNLTIEGDVTGKNYVGAFVGYGTGNSTLSGLTYNGTLTADGYAGSIAGECAGTVTNVIVNGDVTTIGSYVGGVVGNANCSISGATVTGNIKGGAYVGGIAGATEANISNITVTGSVKGTKSRIGGICGIRQSNGDLTNCYAHCDVTGTGESGETDRGNYVGGILGEGSANITHCSSFGNVSGASYVGGVLGGINNSNSYPEFIYVYRRHNSSSDSQSSYDEIKSGTKTTKNISNCYAIGNVKGTGNYIGGICGCYTPVVEWSKTVKATITLYSNDDDHFIRKKGVKTTTTGIFTTYYYTPIVLSLSDNYFSGELMGKDCVGGIVGYCAGTIKQNYSNANITGTNNVGGIVASVMPVEAKYYPYNSATVNSLSSVNSVLMSNMAINSSVVATSNAGRIYGTKAESGVNVGVNGNAAEDNRALYEGTLVISGVTQEVTDSEQNGVNNGAAYFKLKANYVSHGWDFTDNWTNLETETYPYKPWQAAPPTINSGTLLSGNTSISGSSTDGGTVYVKVGNNDEVSTVCSGTSWELSGIPALQSGAKVSVYTQVSGKENSYRTQATVGFPGCGTEADPWRIYSAYDLQGVNKAGYYKQMNDIDLSSWISANSSGKGWVPVGFNGTNAIIYDGAGHKVTGLWVNSTESYTGLFSSFTKGTIRNLNVEVATGKQVKGGDYTGIVIGRIGEGIIENVTAKGNVSGSDYVGGIAGYTTGTVLHKLSYTGQLTVSGDYVGGITSYCSTSTPVTDCETKDITIKATAGTFVGGLVGNAISTSFNKCYVTGTITFSGTNTGVKVGGLVANCANSITECATNVTISSASPQGMTAGLVASNSGTIKRCSTAGCVTSTGTDAYTGGLVAMASTNNSNIEDCYSTANVIGTKWTAGLVAYNYGKVNRCYASGNVASVYYGAGLVGENYGSSAKTTNCVALGSKIEVSDQTGWGIRVVGNFANGAPEPSQDNLFAWGEMQVSENGIPKSIPDNNQDGTAITTEQTRSCSTYESIGWDFGEIWTIPADGYPVLQWQTTSTEPEVKKGDLNGDGTVSITDVVMIIDVIADPITYADKKAAADVNSDGDVTITDCVAAIDLIAAQSASLRSARAKAQALLSNTDFISAAVQDGQLTISLNNQTRYTAFQMIVNMPEGMTLGCATMDEVRGAGHQVMVRELAGGQYLVASFSADNDELTVGSGSLFSIITNGKADSEIFISDIEFATTQAEAYHLADIAVSSTPTGISSVALTTQQTDRIYDLQGRRVTKPTKGLYIYNGKKAIIK